MLMLLYSSDSVDSEVREMELKLTRVFRAELSEVHDRNINMRDQVWAQRVNKGPECCRRRMLI